MRRRTLVGAVIANCLFSASLAAQPFIFYRGILNGASFVAQGLPNGSIARGSIFTIFGRDLGPAGGAQVSAFPLATSLAEVSVEVCQGEQCVAAIPLFVSAGQLNVIMPSNAPLGRVSMRVTFNGEAGNWSPANVVASSVGIFAVNSGGFGPAIVQNFIAADNQPLNSSIAAAQPGQVVTLWGTGLGPALNADNVRPQAGDLPVNVEIFVGGVPVTNKLYSGRSPEFSGLDQIVFAIPAGALMGCYVPVEIRTGGAMVSNSVTIAIAPPGQVCSDPNNPVAAALRAGGRMGLVTLQRTLRFTDDPAPLGERELDLAVAEFREESANPFAYHPDYSLPPVGSCTVQTRRGFVLDVAPKPGSLPSVRTLDAGGALSVATGNGGTPVPKRTDAMPGYLEVLGGRLGGVAGSTLVLNPPVALTVSSSGGADIGAFEVAVPSPATVQWTNRAQLGVINRAAGATVVWSGAGGETVWIWGGAADGVTDATVVFSCLAPASAGSFTIPARVLSRVPPLRTRRSQTNAWLGVADLNSGNLRQFEADGLGRGFADSFAQVVSVVQYR